MKRETYTTAYKIAWAIYWIALLVFCLLHTGTLLGEAGEGRALRADGFVLLLFAILGAFLFCTFFLRPRRKTNKKGRGVVLPMRIWHLLLLVANSLFCFWIIEYINNDAFLEIEPFYVGINLLGIFLIHLLLLFWINDVAWTALAGLSIWCFFSMGFYLVYTFRGEPLQLIDFASIGTAAAVSGNYHMDLPRSFVVDIILWACIGAVYGHLPRIRLARRKATKILLRLAVIALMIGGYFFYLNSRWNAELHIKTDLFAPIKTYKKYGTTVGFFCVGKYMRLVPPEGYSVEKTEEIAARAEALENNDQTTEVRPENIIVIMNEAWSDLAYTGDLPTNLDPMPYYHSMEENTIKGYNLVCIMGGGTAKTEYEFLTGNSLKRFPGMVPYVSYFTHEQYSLVSTLQAQGYEAIAMHPYKASNWNRPAAYRLLGFEQFLAEDAFDANAERIRGHITDRANYEKILQMIEDKEETDRPLFLFDITMQNHGGYTNKNYEGDVVFEGYEAEEPDDAETVNRYLSLSKVTDNALMYLIESLRDVEEPTLLLMFGDHLPTLPDSFTENLSGKAFDELTFEEQQRYYSTPFFVWANYDIPEQQNVLTSTNFLGTILLNQTGLDMPAYNRYLNDLMKKMPALNHLGYVLPAGTQVRWDDAEEPYTTLEWEYECLQYNNLAEKRERLDAFFTMEETK